MLAYHAGDRGFNSHPMAHVRLFNPIDRDLRIQRAVSWTNDIRVAVCNCCMAKRRQCSAPYQPDRTLYVLAKHNSLNNEVPVMISYLGMAGWMTCERTASLGTVVSLNKVDWIKLQILFKYYSNKVANPASKADVCFFILTS